MLKKGDNTQQMVYYQVTPQSITLPRFVSDLFSQAGIGTYTTPQIATPFMSKISKVISS